MDQGEIVLDFWILVLEHIIFSMTIDGSMEIVRIESDGGGLEVVEVIPCMGFQPSFPPF